MYASFQDLDQGSGQAGQGSGPERAISLLLKSTRSHVSSISVFRRLLKKKRHHRWERQGAPS